MGGLRTTHGAAPATSRWLSWLLLLAFAGPIRAQANPVTQGGAPEVARQRPIVRSVRVEGNQRYTAEQIVAAFGQPIGQPLIEEPALRRGIEVLFSTFHVRAAVELVPPADGSREVELVLRIEELPLDLELRIVGNDEIDDDEVREWAGIGTREELFLYQAPRIRSRLLQHYRDEGFYFVEVEVVERPAGVDASGRPVAPDVIFEIQEGPEVKVRDVVLHGNDLLPNEGMLFWKRGLSKLAKAELRPPRFFSFFAKDYVRETLDADVIGMRQVYRDLGYLDAVVELERLDFSEDREWVTIHIAVDEGVPYTVESVEVEAIRRVVDAEQRGSREETDELIVPEEELLGLLELKPGEVFQRRLVEEDHRSLSEFYGARGHIEHDSLPEEEGFRFLDPELVYDSEEPRVRVVYRISQGSPIHIREILVKGNLHTQDRVLRSRVTVEPGQLANHVEIERSRARIEATGFFNPDPFHPDIIPPRVRYVDTGDPAWKDLEFLVEEGGVLSFQVSGGISTTTGLFGTVQLQKGNFDVGNLPSSFTGTIEEIARLEAFHGAGQTLRFQASPGTEQTFFDVFFSEPDIFRLHEDRIGLALDARSLRRDYESHTEERRDYSVRLSRQITPDSSIWTRYDLATADVSDLDRGGEPTLSNPLAVPEDLAAQAGESNVSHLDVGYNFNTLDHPILTRNGLDVNMQAQLYDEVLGSDFDFTKLQVQFDVYDEFDEDPDIVSDYVHAGFLLGAGLPYGGTDEVPYTERWFFGGRQVRGFDFRGIGPNENGHPIGGTTAFYSTLEYRRPLVKNVQPGSYREIEALQAGLFLDFGLLDPDELSLDFDELRISTGVLFGISFPVPLTFSFGFPLRTGDDDDEQVFEFELGF